MRNPIHMLALTAATLFISFNPLKADEVRPGYENGYGMAGCGLGSILAKEVGWSNGSAQIFVATTNNTYGNQTVSMTIGISNCDEGLLTDQLKAEQEVFVGANLASLAKDTARGSGESLEAFADLLGCAESTSDLERFAAIGQSHHHMIFTSVSAHDVLSMYKSAVIADGMSCIRI